MINPEALIPRGSAVLSLIGGMVGMLLFASILFLAPVTGAGMVDIPGLLGGVFTSNPDTAFWIGFWLFFVTGVLFFAPLLAYLWPRLPGRNFGFGGALIKGLVWGLILFILTGLLIPLLGLLNRIEGFENPGLFGWEAGLLAAIALLIAHLVFGLATAVILAMPNGIEPTDTIGWDGISMAAPRDVVIKGDGRRVP
jgi:hypothetical protein